MEHVTCPRCNGTGRVQDQDGVFQECPECGGTGYLDDDTEDDASDGG